MVVFNIKKKPTIVDRIDNVGLNNKYSNWESRPKSQAFFLKDKSNNEKL